MKWCVCEVLSEFDEDFDGSLCRVIRVLQVFDNEADAHYCSELMDPSRYDQEALGVRVVAEDMLDKRFR